MGVPSVLLPKTPERISHRSSSFRCVAISLWPGRRRSNSRWIRASDSSIFGGQPSMTTPTPPPCDSPKVVTRKSWPKVLDIAAIVAQATCLWGPPHHRDGRAPALLSCEQEPSKAVATAAAPARTAQWTLWSAHEQENDPAPGPKTRFRGG